MKVLLVTPLFPPQEGGIQRYLYRVARGFDATEVQVLAVSYNPAAEAPFDTRQPFHIRRVPFTAHLTPLRQLLRALQLHREERFDLLLISTPILGFLVGIPFQWLTGQPFTCLAYGQDVTALTTIWWGASLLRATARAAAGIITISEFTRDYLIAAGISDGPIALVPPAVEECFLAPVKAQVVAALRTCYGFGQSPLLVTAGRLVGRKGHESVIRAMPIVLRQVPDAIYAIVGRGPEYQRLKGLASELGLEEHVRFLGYLPDEELVVLYHACSVFIMPSDSRDASDVEGFGIVYLEAGACGCPAIGGRGGGVGEAIVDGETGLLVAADDGSEVAQAILTLLNDPARVRQMGSRAAERVRAQFTPSAMTQRLRSIVRGYIGER